MTEELWWFPAGAREFIFSKISGLVLCLIEPSIQWVSDALFLGIKQL
jgi:hypothetical protein